MSDVIQKAVEVLKSAKHVAVLTGAGVSAESGVPTFRASDGLWEGHRIEDVATPEGFQRNPDLVWQFYNGRRENLACVSPNSGHFALTELQTRFESFVLATQNVDGLHAAAGTRDVLELHGNVRRTRCLGCEVVEDRGLAPLGTRPLCPACSGQLRPDIVWFHEILPARILQRAMHAADECEVLLVIGTLAVVYPAASMIPRARANDAIVIEINLVPSEAAVDLGLYGASGVILPELCRRLGEVS